MPLSVSIIGRTAMAVMLLFTGVAHFTSTALMEQMVPDIFPQKTIVIYVTGIIEILAAWGLIIPKLARLTSILLILFFLAVLPANIVGSMKMVELGGMENGPAYLWFRIPLQFLFIGWTYFFGIKRTDV